MVPFSHRGAEVMSKPNKIPVHVQTKIVDGQLEGDLTETISDFSSSSSNGFGTSLHGYRLCRGKRGEEERLKLNQISSNRKDSLCLFAQSSAFRDHYQQVEFPSR